MSSWHICNNNLFGTPRCKSYEAMTLTIFWTPVNLVYCCRHSCFRHTSVFLKFYWVLITFYTCHIPVHAQQNDVFSGCQKIVSWYIKKTSTENVFVSRYCNINFISLYGMLSFSFKLETKFYITYFVAFDLREFVCLDKGGMFEQANIQACVS